MQRASNGACSKLLLTPSNEKFGLGDPSEYWVLGDIFLQNYYSIYDYPRGKVGLIESRRGAEGGGGSGSNSLSQQGSVDWEQAYTAMADN